MIRRSFVYIRLLIPFEVSSFSDNLSVLQTFKSYIFVVVVVVVVAY